MSTYGGAPSIEQHSVLWHVVSYTTVVYQIILWPIYLIQIMYGNLCVFVCSVRDKPSDTLRKIAQKTKAKAITYESMLFHIWRSVWCSYITYRAYYNVVRLNAVFEQNPKLDRAAYFDTMTHRLIVQLICFFLLDLVFAGLRRKYTRHMSRSVFIHHIVSLCLASVTMIVSLPHHYYSNLFMCAEIVSCLNFVSYFAKTYKSAVLYKLYLLQYLLLTVFGRFYIWYTVYCDLAEYNVSILCYVGFAPLLIMDIVWSKQCVKGLLRKN